MITTSTTYKFKTRPDSFQIEAVRRALKLKRFGVFFEPRVGKTKVAVDFCSAIATKNPGKSQFLIVCPLFARTEWQRQIAEHSPLENYRVFLYPKEPNKRMRLLEDLHAVTEPVFVIVNYDILAADKEMLLKWKPTAVVFDESHLIGRHASNRSKAAFRLGRHTEYVMLLTGTPVPKKWYGIFGQFRAMNCEVFGTSFKEFERKWAVTGGYMGKEIIACIDPETFSTIIAKHSIRVLRRDVMYEPKAETVILPVTMSSSCRKLYNDLKKKCVAELSTTSTITADMAMTRLMKLQRICGGFIADDAGNVVQVGDDKLQAAQDLVNTRLEGNEPVVVFHRYTAEGDALEKELQTLTTKPVVRIYGETSETDRLKHRDMFQNGESDVIIIQISTGCMSVSLDRSHTIVFYSIDFSLANYLQAKDRVMGRNQKHDVTYYLLAVEKSADERVMEIIGKDEDIANTISNRWRWFFEDE